MRARLTTFMAAAVIALALYGCREDKQTMVLDAGADGGAPDAGGDAGADAASSSLAQQILGRDLVPPDSELEPDLVLLEEDGFPLELLPPASP